jgi:hypothetical protein
MTRLRTFALGTLLAAGIAVPAMAAPSMTSMEPSTRLVECGSASCLVVSGRRDHAAAPVRINGHAVAVAGARRWRASVPVETLRAWSAPYARTITVSVAGLSRDARLPIGLLGHTTDLAMLVVRVK